MVNSFPTKISSRMKSLASLATLMSSHNSRRGVGLTIPSTNRSLGKEVTQPRINWLITQTTEAYKPMILWIQETEMGREGEKKAGKRSRIGKEASEVGTRRKKRKDQ